MQVAFNSEAFEASPRWYSNFMHCNRRTQSRKRASRTVFLCHKLTRELQSEMNSNRSTSSCIAFCSSSFYLLSNYLLFILCVSFVSKKKKKERRTFSPPLLSPTPLPLSCPLSPSSIALLLLSLNNLLSQKSFSQALFRRPITFPSPYLFLHKYHILSCMSRPDWSVVSHISPFIPPLQVHVSTFEKVRCFVECLLVDLRAIVLCGNEKQVVSNGLHFYEQFHVCATATK